jgi:putative redox protein
VRFTGDRADAEPHRLTRVHMAFELEGVIPQAQLDRALRLSREKYCSVWNSLREDIPLDVTTSIASRPPA